MVQAKPFVVLACILVAALLPGIAQTISLPQVKDPSIPQRTLPGAIDSKLANLVQPKVIVKTLEVKNIKDTAATATYAVTFEGLNVGTDIRASSNGVVVNMTSGPTVENTNLKFGISKACLYSSTGCADMTGLRPSYRYCVRAFYTITDGKITGTFYGNELYFTTLAQQPPAK